MPQATLQEIRARLDRESQEAELAHCRRSFTYALAYWSFSGREGTGVHTMAALWPGQQQLADVMERARWIIDLKAGKQGHSEIECAWDWWASWSGPPGNRVHIFSDGHDEAKDFLAIVKFGIEHLPSWFGVKLLDREPGGDTTESLRYRLGVDDVRTIAAYPARPGVGIAQSAHHAHVDELAKMQWGRAVLAGIQTTLGDGGSLHVISRGRSPDDEMATQWQAVVPEGMSYAEAHRIAMADVARGNLKRVVPIFTDYTGRPGHDAAWREAESQRMSPAALRHFAPQDPEDALSGDADQVFVEESQWAQLEVVDPISPGDRTPMVVSLDAGVKSDHFALVGVTRCPNHHDEPAIRHAHEWIPDPVVSFQEVKDYIRQMYVDYNVVQVTFDPSQLYDMAQEMGKLGWWEEFNQGQKRLVADAGFRQRIVERRMARINHDGLSAAITNAGVKLDRDEKKLRIVKRTAKKIDLAVAASQGVYEVLGLNL